MAFVINIYKQDEQSSRKELLAYTTIIIDDIREGQCYPKRYPLKLASNDKEMPSCNITFAYEFNKADNFE